jgi:2-C-methyl-D-erythritol 2,4-cyclodiphosphate synthase
MREKISGALGITARQVGIKATTNETMGFVGRKEGIAAMAVALLAAENISNA